MLSPVPIAPQNTQKMKDWVQTFGVAARQMAKAGKIYSPDVPQSERNLAGWTSQLQTLSLWGAAKKKKKKKRPQQWQGIRLVISRWWDCMWW